MNPTDSHDALFSGVIGKDYDLLKLICPLAAEMSRLVGNKIKDYQNETQNLSIVELGGGTGITTLAILNARDDIEVLSIDNEPTMQNQAEINLQTWVMNKKLQFSNLDALTALQNMPAETVDVVASAYTLHNFLDTYRAKVITEIYRVLNPGGIFVNGDRYALDGISQHTQMIQKEVSNYFKVLTAIDRLDLLEHWIVHLFSDESENHVMRESAFIKQLKCVGFCNIELSNRQDVNALVSATKA